MKMKKLALVLIGLLLMFTLAGCATVNGDNSFQGQAPGGVTTTQQNQAPQQNQQTVTQPTDTQQTAGEPTAAPSQNPDASGYNG